METSKKKGFTLIELMIVIIIIGILATIMIIAYNSIVAKSRRAATIQALNDGIQGAATCVAGGSSVVGPPYVYGNTICTDSTITSAKWPAASLNGYNIAEFSITLDSSTGSYSYGTWAGLTVSTISRTGDPNNSPYHIACDWKGQCRAKTP